MVKLIEMMLKENIITKEIISKLIENRPLQALSFSKIIELLEEKTRAVVVYGDDRRIIMDDLKKLIPIPLPAFNVKGALVGAFEVAAKGDIVLFSPGGSSCEPYKNFEERGEAFKQEFNNYKDYYENTPGI